MVSTLADRPYTLQQAEEEMWGYDTFKHELARVRKNRNTI